MMSLLAALPLAFGWSFSVPEAPYSIDRVERDGVKPAVTVTPEEIRVGNRAVRLNGSVLSVLANGMELVRVFAWYATSKNFSPINYWQVTPQRDGQGVHRVATLTGDCTKDGKDVAVESDVRVMPNGEIELTIFNPGSEPTRGATAFNMSMPSSLWHDQWVSINGSQPFRVPPTAHEWELTPFPQDAKMYKNCYPAGSTFSFLGPDGKTVRFGFRLGENASGAGINRSVANQVGLGFGVRDPSKLAKVYFNLGDTRVPREKPHLAGGVNWKVENDFDVACWDEKRNLFVNGGIESGMRYWRGDVRLSEDAHTGKYALSGRPGPDSAIKTVGTVLKPDTWYTFGAWVKAKDGQGGSISIHPRGYGWSEGFLSRVPMSLTCGNGWQHVSGSFKTKPQTGETTIWLEVDWRRMVVDDLCLVAGSNAVATVANPWGLEIRTGAEDNLFVPAERKNGKIQLVVRGPKGSKAKLDISGGDLLGRKTIAKTASVTIPDSGETLVDLGKDEEFPKGVNGIKVRVQPLAERAAPLQTAVGARLAPRIAPASQLASLGGYPRAAYTDYLRFMKAHWGDNRQKHRYMQMDKGGSSFVGGLERLGRERYERKLKRDVMLGMGALNYTTPWSKPEFFSAEEQAILDKYGIVDLWGGVCGHLDWKEWLNGKPWEWQGKKVGEFVEYPPEFLKWVEDETCEFAKKVPGRRFWSYKTEPMGGHASLRAGRFDEYAKLMLAFNRGLKRANPENEFCPYGCYNMGAGTAEIAAALKAMSVVEPATRFKTVEVHSYRPFPEDPDTQRDLDVFFSRLAEIGYGDIQIKIGEGSYYFPMMNSKIGLSPWSGVDTHDKYSGIVMPSYDLGFGEKIGAALTTRETAIYYKNDKRVFCNGSWSPAWIDSETPCGWLVANAALLEMLGDATYLGEVRFAPKSRAMFFNDGHGALTVFMWRGDATFDMGQTGPVEAEIDFGDLKPEFYDLYANEVKVKGEGEGKRMVKIPLSGYPIYIKLPKAEIGRAKEFKKAIAETLVRADLNKLPLTCSLTLKDPKTVEVKVVNTLSRTVKARVKVDGADKGEVSFAGLKSVSFDVTLKNPVSTVAYTPVEVPVEFAYEGKTFAETFKTSAVAVGYVKGNQPDWEKIPAVDIENFSMWQDVGPHKSKADMNATVKLAWNEKHLWMRFKVKDDIFMATKKSEWRVMGEDSDMIDIFFDGYANARENIKNGQVGCDYDDFIFRICPTSDKSAACLRTRAPDHQLTGGADHGFKTGFEKHVKTEFAADAKGYEVTLDFPAYYMMPVKLKADGISPGFGIIVYDRDQDQCPARKGVKNFAANSSPYDHPEVWPQLIFAK